MSDQEREQSLARVEETWEEMGFRFRPLRNVVLIRTEPHPTKTPGGIYLPTKITNFYGALANVQLVTAVVLSSGPKAVLKSGDRIAFTRLFFARWLEMADKTLVGWIANEENVLGYAEGEHTYAPIDPCVQPAPRAPAGLIPSDLGS